MTTAESAKAFYERELKTRLELEHPDEFLAIEPKSKSFFLGDTFISAALAARQAFPDRTSFVLRIGREAAFHLGASST